MNCPKEQLAGSDQQDYIKTKSLKVTKLEISLFPFDNSHVSRHL